MEVQLYQKYQLSVSYDEKLSNIRLNLTCIFLGYISVDRWIFGLYLIALSKCLYFIKVRPNMIKDKYFAVACT